MNSLKRDNIDLRRALPIGFLREGTIKAEQMEQLLQIITKQANLQAAVEELNRQLLARMPNPQPNGDFQRFSEPNWNLLSKAKIRAIALINSLL